MLFHDIGLRHRDTFRSVHVWTDLNSLEKKYVWYIQSIFFKVVLFM